MTDPVFRDIAKTLNILDHDIFYLEKLTHEELKDLHTILLQFEDEKFGHGYEDGHDAGYNAGLFACEGENYE